LAKLKISPNGLGGALASALIEGAFLWMRQIGNPGGKSRSASKAKASRENGKRRRGRLPKNEPLLEVSQSDPPCGYY
jgi:hypothetical protein